MIEQMKRLVIDIDEAQAMFAKLVEAAGAGDVVIIESRGKPVAKLIGYKPAPAPRKPGMFAGQITIDPGFEEMPKDFEQAFE